MKTWGDVAAGAWKTRCTALETAHTDMAAQLADALTERDRARAQVAARDATIAGLQEALCGANEGKAFYEAAFCDKCKGASNG